MKKDLSCGKRLILKIFKQVLQQALAFTIARASGNEV